MTSTSGSISSWLSSFLLNFLWNRKLQIIGTCVDMKDKSSFECSFWRLSLMLHTDSSLKANLTFQKKKSDVNLFTTFSTWSIHCLTQDVTTDRFLHLHLGCICFEWPYLWFYNFVWLKTYSRINHAFGSLINEENH